MGCFARQPDTAHRCLVQSVATQAPATCLALNSCPRPGLCALKQQPDHDTDVFNSEGLAPLHLAARGGHMGAVAFLLQRKTFVDMQDAEASCVIHQGTAWQAPLFMRRLGLACSSVETVCMRRFDVCS